MNFASDGNGKPEDNGKLAGGSLGAFRRDAVINVICAMGAYLQGEQLIGAVNSFGVLFRQRSSCPPCEFESLIYIPLHRVVSGAT